MLFRSNKEDEMKIRFSIPGNPTAQKRHRTITKGKGGQPLPYARSYDPSESDKGDFLSMAMKYRPKHPVEGLVIITFAFWMMIPKGYSQKFKTEAQDWGDLNEHIPLWKQFKSSLAHLKRPDTDNLIKLVMDALNGVYWKDDSQVQFRAAFKIYSNEPRTELQIYLEGGEYRGEENTSSS